MDDLIAGAERVMTYGWPVRVYYEDTDHGGVVYYANYLKFMERCRTEFLRSKGLEQDQLTRQWDVIFAVRRVAVDYLSPAKFNDQLLVTARVASVSKVRMVFEQSVYRLAHSLKVSEAGFYDNDKVESACERLCKAEIVVVSLSASQFRPKRIPEKLFEELRRER